MARVSIGIVVSSLAALGVSACEEQPAPAAVKPATAAPKPSTSATPAPGSASARPLPSKEPAVPALLTLERDGGAVPAARAKRILHVGDSMVPLVGNYLRKVVQARGDKYYIESVTSSSTLSWDNERLLQEAMYRYDPEVILISLGSNELFDENPQRRAAAIRRLVADTKGRPCLWIGPPAWKKDKGFIDVLQKNLGECRYFDSIRLKLPRMADGRHPSWTGGYRWATAVWKVLGGTEEIPTR